MRTLIQVFCVLAIAIGAGLIGFSNKLEPQLVNSYKGPDAAPIAAMAGGFGISFLWVGILGLIMPWLNRIGSINTSELGDNSARTMSTIAIWLSMTTILTFGVFRQDLKDAAGLVATLIIVALMCAAATVTSAIVFGWKPWVRNNQNMTESDRQSTL